MENTEAARRKAVEVSDWAMKTIHAKYLDYPTFFGDPSWADFKSRSSKRGHRSSRIWGKVKSAGFGYSGN